VWADSATVAAIARRAEELGYHSLWTMQRLLSDVDGQMGEQYRSVLDPIVALSYAAALTSRIRLGVAVLNMPFVSPVLLAKQTSTLDVLSGGRLELGLGLGWNDNEYTASGVTKEQVGRRGEEFVAALRRLWQDDVVEHHGAFYDIPRSRMEPKPVQRPRPPILLGGTGPVSLRRAGRIADGWVSSSRADLRRIGESVRLVREAATAAGRDPDHLRFVCRGVVRLAGELYPPVPAVGRNAGSGPAMSEAGRAPLTGTAEQIRADLGDLEEQGITELFVDLNFDPRIGSPAADPVAARELAEAVLVGLAP
jgi:probable F420-dependent oxidoreductase